MVLARADDSAGGKAVSLAELVGRCRGRDVALIHDLGAGGVMSLPNTKLGGQPTAQESLSAGADLVLVRGDMLLGGPSCGILLGRKPLVERIAGAALAPLLRPARLSLAALAATLRLYREPDRARLLIPVLRLLTTSAENLRNRAERLAPQAAATAAVAEAQAVADVAYLQGEPSEAAKLPTWCIALRPATGSAERLDESLRAGAPPVFGRLFEDRLLLDLRSVLPRHDVRAHRRARGDSIVRIIHAAEMGGAECAIVTRSVSEVNPSRRPRLRFGLRLRRE